jgi:hypothetical protein
MKALKIKSCCMTYISNNSIIKKLFMKRTIKYMMKINTNKEIDPEILMIRILLQRKKKIKEIN